MIERVCEHEPCGATFTVRFPSNRKRFCSQSCADKSRGADPATLRRTCEQCGASFTVDRPSRRQRFCSRACADKSRAHDPDTLRRTCEQCGEAFTVRWQSDPKRFCSSRCSNRGSNGPNWRGGKTFHPLYGTWVCMIYRCENPNNHAYSRYGGRGITVCDRWRADFWAFAADMGPKPTPGHSIDRIDNDGPYSAQNCRWATKSQQRANQRPRKRRAA